MTRTPPTNAAPATNTEPTRSACRRRPGPRRPACAGGPTAPISRRHKLPQRRSAGKHQTNPFSPPVVSRETLSVRCWPPAPDLRLLPGCPQVPSAAALPENTKRTHFHPPVVSRETLSFRPRRRLTLGAQPPPVAQPPSIPRRHKPSHKRTPAGACYRFYPPRRQRFTPEEDWQGPCPLILEIPWTYSAKVRKRRRSSA
jgi:hypothetical protein